MLARRLVERGVRFVELTCPSVAGNDRWDQHGRLKKGHAENARAVDQPIAGLAEGPQSRAACWRSTLVVWSGEFGRTPFAQGTDGRDHNPFGFHDLAGRRRRSAAARFTARPTNTATRRSKTKCTMHDLHATMLHLLGMDHKRLTYRFGGRDMRLTDVFGEVVTGILS